LFRDYFNSPDAALAQFYAKVYLYRHEAANRMHIEYQVFANTILLKFKALRVFAFSRFAQNTLLPKITELESSLRHSLDQILNEEICFKAIDVLMDRGDVSRYLKRKELLENQNDNCVRKITSLQPKIR
jgi:hypothetical protein